MRICFFQNELGFYEDPKCHNAIDYGEWDFIMLKGKSSLVYLALRQILQLLWMEMRFLLGNNEDASCRRAEEVCLMCLCQKSVSVEIWDVQVWFGRGDMQYNLAYCLLESIILYVAKSCKTQPCGKRMTQQFSKLVILLTDTRFKLKEETQRNTILF